MPRKITKLNYDRSLWHVDLLRILAHLLGYGRDLRERWGLSPHQELSPALEDKLAYFATVAGSYEMAARLACKLGMPIEDSTVRALVQRLGARAQEQTEQRLKTVPRESQPERPASPLGVIMIDGFKVGVFYRQEHNAKGQLSEKVSVSWQGEAVRLGERLHWEALRHGLGRAQHSLAVGDGAPWVWGLIAERWPQAHQLLDFYHASQHLHALAEALYPEQEELRRRWVDQQCHDLRHGKEKKVLQRISQLRERAAPPGEIIRREKNYFQTHRQRMNYQQLARRGWPIGSGPVESACAQKQGRFKRPGQFWTRKGLCHLNALIETRDLNYWDQLWTN